MIDFYTTIIPKVGTSDALNKHRSSM